MVEFFSFASFLHKGMACKKYSKILGVQVSRWLLKLTASVEVLQLQGRG